MLRASGVRRTAVSRGLTESDCTLVVLQGTLKAEAIVGGGAGTRRTLPERLQPHAARRGPRGREVYRGARAHPAHLSRVQADLRIRQHAPAASSHIQAVAKP